jgi:hypothetical protein
MPEVAMWKRLLALAGVALAAAVIVPAALEVHAYRQKLARGRLIDQEHCNRIKVGMSQAEVEEILGGPPGDFTTQPVAFVGPCLTGLPRLRWERWAGNRAMILVRFDEQDQVQLVWLGDDPIPVPPPSLAERVGVWVQRLWP